MSIIVTNEDAINIQVFAPDLGVQPPCESFNYGLFLPPCDGRAGKFLLEDRPLRDYPFHNCVPYLELKYKKRVYKMLNLDEKYLKQLHSKTNLKKLMDFVTSGSNEKVERLLSQGLDPNYHEPSGETPLTTASMLKNNKNVLLALIGGGAHLDFRNVDGQTALHKAVLFSEIDNVRTLLELGAAPNSFDPLGLSPLYYSTMDAHIDSNIAELLLRDGALIDLQDSSGNRELHQACKNGLNKHIEHMLYYGAVVDAQNNNGNTPLHVCAVNDRPGCARVLLFRGADPSVENVHHQTALHLAGSVGHRDVVRLLREHDPAIVVPHRELPVYNCKRRLSSAILRRRSFSQTSLSSSQSSLDSLRRPSVLSIGDNLQSHRYSSSSVSVLIDREYGLFPVRKYAPEMVASRISGHELNFPRILVIPRVAKGFGFILRGAKKIEPGVQFEPTCTVPALQFFEGVDMSGMSMKVGLRPGDFLLEIDGVDVRMATHDQVVDLIQSAGDTITLKVITIDSRIRGGTMPARRLKARTSLPPPAPPVRHPNTVLLSLKDDRFHDRLSVYANAGSQITSMKSTESLSMYQFLSQKSEEHVASVKCRPTSRRISAAELEHLMNRQNSEHRQAYLTNILHDSSRCTLQDGFESPQMSKKYTSVADMKRRSQRVPPSPPMIPGYQERKTSTENEAIIDTTQITNMDNRPLTSLLTSSPDLNCDQASDSLVFLRRQSTDDYARPYSSNTVQHGVPDTVGNGSTDNTVHNQVRIIQNCHANTVHNCTPNTVLISRPNTLPPPIPQKSAINSTCTRPPSPPPLPSNLQPSSIPTTIGGDCRGVTVDLLKSVKLNKAVESSKSTQRKNNSQSMSNRTNVPHLDFNLDLESALAKRRNRTASIRNNKAEIETESEHNTSGLQSNPTGRFNGLSLNESVRQNVVKSDKSKQQQQQQRHSPPPPVVNGLRNKKDSGYTSSRTSLEPSECGDEQMHATTVIHIDANGASFPPPPSPEILNAAMNNTDEMSSTVNRVTMLSRQLEDRIVPASAISPPPPPPPVPKKPVDLRRLSSVLGHEQDSVSIASSTLSTLSNYSHDSSPSPRFQSPAIHYVAAANCDPDSGTGDSDADDVTPTISRLDLSSFQVKRLYDWTPDDVADWLVSLRLDVDYGPRFRAAGVSGAQLVRCDRTRFTSLGLTRLAHRKTIEQSLSQYRQ